MILKKVRLELDTSDVQQILSIALDEDRDKALAYIKGKLAISSPSVLSLNKSHNRLSRPTGRI